MLNIAICDDEYFIIKQLEALLHEYFLDLDYQYTLHTFVNGEEFLQSDMALYNIVFLDVQIGTLNGFDIAAQLKNINPNSVLIFISQYNDINSNGYRVNAFRYILKPSISTFFNSDMGEALKKLNADNDKYCFKISKSDIFIPYDEILYFESSGHKIYINTVNTQDKDLTFSKKLDEVEADVSGKYFIRVQKSLLINVNHITKMSGYKVYMDNGTVFNATRIGYDKLLEQYVRLKRGL